MVEVVLNVGIAVASNVHGVIFVRVGAKDGFPCVWNAIIVGVCGFGAFPHIPCGWRSIWQTCFVGDEGTLLAKGHDFVYHVAVCVVALRE